MKQDFLQFAHVWGFLMFFAQFAQELVSSNRSKSSMFRAPKCAGQLCCCSETFFVPVHNGLRCTPGGPSETVSGGFQAFS